MHKILNICLVSAEYPPETGFGGIGTYTYQLAHGLAGEGHKVTVVSKSLSKEKQYLDNEVKIYRIVDRFDRSLFQKITNRLLPYWFDARAHSQAVFNKIEELSAGQNFDIIETPLWMGEGSAYDSNKVRAPLFVRLETPIFKSRRIAGLPRLCGVEWLEKKSLQKATLIGAISRDIGRLISDHYGIDPEKIIYSPLGVRFPKLPVPIFRSDSYRLLFVGRLEKRKGLDELIEALSKILSSNTKITVDLVGLDTHQAPGGISYEEYVSKIVPQQVRSRVRLHGFVDDNELKDLYRQCDLFIAPSRYESFGIIFLEAMGYGKPVIGTKVGGIPEIINNQVGRVVSPNNPKEIQKAVEEIFSNEKIRKTLGRNAFKHSREKFDVSSMVENTLACYTSAIEKFNGIKYA